MTMSLSKLELCAVCGHKAFPGLRFKSVLWLQAYPERLLALSRTHSQVEALSFKLFKVKDDLEF